MAEPRVLVRCAWGGGRADGLKQRASQGVGWVGRGATKEPVEQSCKGGVVQCQATGVPVGPEAKEQRNVDKLVPSQPVVPFKESGAEDPRRALHHAAKAAQDGKRTQRASVGVEKGNA